MGWDSVTVYVRDAEVTKLDDQGQDLYKWINYKWHEPQNVIEAKYYNSMDDRWREFDP